VTYSVPDRSTSDALTVLALHVGADHRGAGLGRALVHQVAREALRRPRVRAVEALASRFPGAPCLVPLDFWLACGFSIVHDHPLTPRVRLDARVLATLRSEVEEAVELAWDRLRGAVRPEPAPGPALTQPRSSTLAR
jgi:GNAT superfamily N-acetyltransferase